MRKVHVVPMVEVLFVVVGEQMVIVLMERGNLGLIRWMKCLMPEKNSWEVARWLARNHR
jgi:hypothetical protein